MVISVVFSFLNTSLDEVNFWREIEPEFLNRNANYNQPFFFIAASRVMRE